MIWQRLHHSGGVSCAVLSTIVMNIIQSKGLRSKVLLAFAAGVSLLIVSLFFNARSEISKSYSALETEKTLVQLNASLGMLNEQRKQLHDSNADYAHWDATYAYLKSPNSRYVSENFSVDTFKNLKIQTALLLNTRGDIVFEKSVNLDTLKTQALSVQLASALAKGGVLSSSRDQAYSGFFLSSQGLCIISSQRVLQNDSKGPSLGTLVMVKPVTKSMLQEIEAITAVRILINPAIYKKDDRMYRDKVNQAHIKSINEHLISGYVVLQDVIGDGLIVLSVDVEHKALRLVDSTFKFFYGMLAMMLATLLIASLMVDKFILKRLAHLGNSVQRIGMSTSMTEQIDGIEGNDEMAQLAHGINTMLARLNESQAALKFEKERALVTLAGIADAVITTDTEGRVLYMNATAEHLSGLESDKAKGVYLQSLFKLFSEDKTEAIDSNWLIEANSELSEVCLQRQDGVSFTITKSTSSLFTEHQDLFAYVTVLHDVTMLRSLSKQLSYQARHDALTGLVNRYEFDCMAHAAIEDANLTNRIHSLAYMDLDQFKVVNDTCGHLAGDMLLRQLTELLSSKMRQSDTLARIGGDEFAVLLPGCPIEKAQEILEGVLNAVREFRFSYDERIFKVGLSVGLTQITPNQNLSLSELLGMADAACYEAKKDGGNRVYEHNFDDSYMQERNSQLEWVSRIHMALEEQRFVLYIQRMECLIPNGEKHCELLIRMRGADGTLYAPGFFLPAAERYHLMPMIDRWVVAEALAIMARKGESFDYVCAINLSGHTLTEDDFLEYVMSKIEYYGVDSRRICFEITETAVIANMTRACKLIQGLREIGCRFSLDDFGSGLSSFGYLKNLDVDFLKIDGMFLKTIVSNKIDRAMVESINNVGHVMGLYTIAEFVENEDVIAIMKEIGVDYVQGYGVAKPVPFE
jgi:diguanylate cyclase (GGDEF)-like protein/PAS domain S-box-containing protein